MNSLFQVLLVNLQPRTEEQISHVVMQPIKVDRGEHETIQEYCATQISVQWESFKSFVEHVPIFSEQDSAHSRLFISNAAYLYKVVGVNNEWLAYFEELDETASTREFKVVENPTSGFGSIESASVIRSEYKPAYLYPCHYCHTTTSITVSKKCLKGHRICGVCMSRKSAQVCNHCFIMTNHLVV